MALVRQLPQLYLRGSLVNITMARLTPQQRALADYITDYVAEHKEMSRHRHQMMKELGGTIAADYRDDRQAADQEFRIAVWRAVVNLYFHRKYTFQCRACGHSTYTTKRHVRKAIDRIQTPCPNCGQVEITKTGCSSFAVGTFVPHTAFQESYRYVPQFNWQPVDLKPPAFRTGTALHTLAPWSDARFLGRYRKLTPHYPRTLRGAGELDGGYVVRGPETTSCEGAVVTNDKAVTDLASYCRLKRSQFSHTVNSVIAILPDKEGKPVTCETRNAVLTLGEDEFLAYPVWILDAPQCKSTIDAIPGEACYPHPDDVVNDTAQMVKFFGEFVWNYFRQQLRENSRTEHHREPQEIVGRADEVIVQEIVSLCAKLKVDCNFCSETQPEDGWYRMNINGLQTPPEFSGEFALLLQKARQHGLRVEIGPTTISVREAPTAETTTALVVKPEHVMVLDNSISVSDESDDGAFTINQISFKTVGAQRMDPEDHARTIERADVARAVKAALPDGNCRRIWELYTQDGETYKAFRAHREPNPDPDGPKYIYPFDYDGLPKQQHMAAFLKITPRAVKAHVADIRLHCLAHNFSPASAD